MHFTYAKRQVSRKTDNLELQAWRTEEQTFNPLQTIIYWNMWEENFTQSTWGNDLLKKIWFTKVQQIFGIPGQKVNKTN